MSLCSHSLPAIAHHWSLIQTSMKLDTKQSFGGKWLASDITIPSYVNIVTKLNANKRVITKRMVQSTFEHKILLELYWCFLLLLFDYVHSAGILFLIILWAVTCSWGCWSCSDRGLSLCSYIKRWERALRSRWVRNCPYFHHHGHFRSAANSLGFRLSSFASEHWTVCGKWMHTCGVCVGALSDH